MHVHVSTHILTAYHNMPLYKLYYMSTIYPTIHDSCALCSVRYVSVI